MVMKIYLQKGHIMLELITDFSKKSFKNYSMKEELKFNTINIIYGVNGRGKN